MLEFSLLHFVSAYWILYYPFLTALFLKLVHRGESANYANITNSANKSMLIRIWLDIITITILLQSSTAIPYNSRAIHYTFCHYQI